MVEVIRKIFLIKRNRQQILSIVVLTIYNDIEAATLLCSFVTDSRPRDTVSSNRKGIIRIEVARRHRYIFQVRSWKLPLEPKDHSWSVWLKFLYSVHWAHDPGIRVHWKVERNRQVLEIGIKKKNCNATNSYDNDTATDQVIVFATMKYFFRNRRQIKNLFLPLTQDSGAFSLQFVSFWHAVYLGPLNAYKLSQ